jgi:hypothetical protein
LNAKVAQAEGLSEFTDARFEPLSLQDCAGEAHEFHFRTHLFGPGVALDAFEIRDGCAAGYRFQVIGDLKDDLLAPPGGLGRAVVRGLIAWDEAEDGQFPLTACGHSGV